MSGPQLASLSVKELRDLAAAKGVANRSKLKKQELIEALSAPTPAPVISLESSSSPAGSSAVCPPPPAPVASSGPEPGLPIPDRYGCDRLVLMVQDPSHLFAYWELSGGALDRARRELGESGTPVLVLHAHGGSEQREVDLLGGNYYLAVATGSHYRADLALRARDGRLSVVASSLTVQTPASGPSNNTDEEWMAVDSSFDQLVAAAGLPGAAPSSIALAATNRLRARLWQETGVFPISSEVLSSHSLSSHSLGSHTLAQARP